RERERERGYRERSVAGEPPANRLPAPHHSNGFELNYRAIASHEDLMHFTANITVLATPISLRWRIRLTQAFSAEYGMLPCMVIPLKLFSPDNATSKFKVGLLLKLASCSRKDKNQELSAAGVERQATVAEALYNLARASHHFGLVSVAATYSEKMFNNGLEITDELKPGFHLKPPPQVPCGGRSTKGRFPVVVSKHSPEKNDDINALIIGLHLGSPHWAIGQYQLKSTRPLMKKRDATARRQLFESEGDKNQTKRAATDN
ncbi:LOW QUALITY PROTEIN: hypothetical protein M8C21_010834, partial [Ambrosia artemisiifolia]